MHEFDESLCKQRAHTISSPPELVKMTWMEMLLRTERQRWIKTLVWLQKGVVPSRTIYITAHP